MGNTIAVIDVGTNSALLLIARRSAKGVISLHEESQTPRVGAGIATTQRISAPAVTRLVRTLRLYRAVCTAAGASQVIAVGTEVFRRARNAHSVIPDVADQTGIRLRVLSARREARYALHGALSGLPPVRGGLLVDLGGGSTELVRFQHGEIVSTRSVPMGCVVFAETVLRRFCGISEKRLAEARAAVARRLSSIPREYCRPPGHIIAVGGTATTLAALNQRLPRYQPERVQGYVLSRERIEAAVRRFRHLSRPQLQRRIPYDPQRAAVLPAGTFLLAEVLKHLGAQEVAVSHRGLRWGIAREFLAARDR